MKRTERHHVIPISLQGWDEPENVIYVNPQEHKKIHKCLDVPYKSIRLFRKRTNQIIFVNEYWVRELTTLQYLFFRNVAKLDEYTQKLIAESLEKQADKLRISYGIQNFLIKRDGFKDITHRVFYMLHAYHSLYLIIVLKRNREHDNHHQDR